MTCKNVHVLNGKPQTYSYQFDSTNWFIDSRLNMFETNLNGEAII